jgi:hydrogenase maturation protease
MKILVAGVGNVFLGDDGFGVEVVQRLAARDLPACVTVMDVGIRSFDLAYALQDGYDVSIIVDASPRKGEPGAVYLIEPDLEQTGDVSPDAHSMSPIAVFQLVKHMGGRFKRILIVGCEPLAFSADEPQMGLSEPVAKAVDQAVSLILETIHGLALEAKADA